VVRDGTTADRPPFIIAARPTDDQVSDDSTSKATTSTSRSDAIGQLPSLFDTRKISTDVLIVIFGGHSSLLDVRVLGFDMPGESFGYLPTYIDRAGKLARGITR